MRAALGLAAWLLVAFVPAAIGALFAPGEWYRQLEKPAWTPPGWLFGPVWTALYALMGVAAWLVWRRGGFAAAGPALSLFFLQLALNAAWTPAFFGLRRPDLGLLVIVALWLAVVATTVAFWRHRPLAGALLLPYLGWISFAAALNLRIWQLYR
jgi:translocator protein